MLVSARKLKWVLRFYPPLFFQRIWLLNIADNFTSLQVKITKSIFNTNYNSTIFGGTIFSAADVCYPVLFHQLLGHKGYKVTVWSRSAQVHFIKKSKGDIKFRINLSDEDIRHTEELLNEQGKYIKTFPINIYSENGDICATILCEVYIRNLNYIKHNE